MKSFSIPTGSDKDIDSLIEYVLDVKPYHSKLLLVTEESIFADRMKLRIVENLMIQEGTGAPPPPPPVTVYGWTRDGITDPLSTVTIHNDGEYLTFSPSSTQSSTEDGTSVMIRSKQPITGKKYCEFKVTAQATNSYVALGISGATPSQFTNPGASAVYIGSGECGIGTQGIYINGSSITGQARYSFTTGDTIGLAIDVAEQKVWIRKNADWIDGQPESGSAPSFIVPFAGPLYFANMHFTCTTPGSKTVYIYPSAATQEYPVPAGFSAYAPA